MSSDKSRFTVRIAAVLTVIALTVFILWLFPKGSNEPSYHGRSLSYWVDRIDDHVEARCVTWAALPQKTARELEAAEAICAIGTNGIPFLLNGLHATNSSFYEKKEKFLNYIYVKTHPNNPNRQPPYSSAEITRWKSAVALETLGPLVEPATKDLEKLLFTAGGSDGGGELAAFVLGGMGPRGISILTNAVQPSTDWAGICALWSLGQHHSSVTNLVPFLVPITAQTNESLAIGAVWALGQIHSDPARVVPVLISLLQGQGQNLPGFSAEALGKFGTNAMAALPDLRLRVNDPLIGWNGWNAKDVIKKIEGNVEGEKKTNGGKK